MTAFYGIYLVYGSRYKAVDSYGGGYTIIIITVIIIMTGENYAKLSNAFKYKVDRMVVLFVTKIQYTLHLKGTQLKC